MREQIPASPGGGPDVWDRQATAQLQRFMDTDDLTALHKAIDLLRRAVLAIPPGADNQARRPTTLGGALRARFGRAAITGPRDRARLLSNLGSALQERFERLGQLADLNEAVEVGRAAVRAASPDHRLRVDFLANLGKALQTRFAQVGDPADLDEAIEVRRTAVRATAAGDPDGAEFLATLSAALRQRFEQIGELADLDEAVEIARAAVQAAPAGHPDRVMALFHLGQGLQARFERFRELADIDEAVEVGRAAVQATPIRHPDRAAVLYNLGTALRHRIEWVGELVDLDESIEVARAAVQVTPTRHPDRAAVLFNLGAALHARFDRVGELADLDESIEIGHATVRAIPAGHPERAAALVNLGDALRDRFERVREPSEAAAALAAWREATAVAAARLSVRMIAARSWGLLAAQRRRWPDAVDGYAAAVGLLPLLAWRGVSRASRERLLADWGGLAADAAACAIAANQPNRAIELLEQGRGVLWSQLLEIRTDLDALRGTDPRLAAELAAARDDLDRPTTAVGASLGMAEVGSAVDVEARMAWARRWDGLIERVRALPGFGDFARPPEEADLRRAAAGGTVVVVNVSRLRCDALLVTDTSVEIVELPDLTHGIAADRADTYLRALLEFDTTRRDPHAARIAFEQAITASLEWLWDAVAEPVLNALGHRHTPATDERWSRVWWCPTGPLTVLPLHAAGHHDQLDGRSVLDRVVSSYTPTLRALAEARARSHPTESGRLLLIAVPNTPGQERLPAIAAEQTLLTGLFTAEQRTILVDTAATRTAMLNHLPTHTWVHASCHGDQDLANPTRGGLLPYDWDTAGPVGVRDTTTSDHTGGEFVFLSACKTAAGSTTNPDEAINLAAALQYAGWRHVIGTLWTVWDTAAADIASGVYPRLVRNGHLDPTHTAEALHHALRDYRDSHRYQPSRWTPFLHIGP
jgi:tetratricopeptide (TPR) repeat protein